MVAEAPSGAPAPPGNAAAAAEIPLVARAAVHGGRTAIVDREGEHGYDDLLSASGAVARRLLGEEGGRRARRDLEEARVAFMLPSGFGRVAVQWGIWRAGGIAVPLCTSHPAPELACVLDDAGAETVVAAPEFAERLRPLAEQRGLPFLTVGEEPRQARRPETGGRSRRPAGTGRGSRRPPEAGRVVRGPAVEDDPRLPRPEEGRGALILYTSGTTGRAKGALHTHRSLGAQVESLVEAWEWSPDDRILHVLPLHHTHGIVNALLCALGSGATCEMPGGFDAEAVWRRIVAGAEGVAPPITLFMAVPTVYVKLLAAWEDAASGERRRMSRAARSLRLWVSGSAALPVQLFHRWREISGHALLERYGMTEIGMALSNPVRGERRPGTVGRPLPGVEVRLVDEAGEVLAGEGRPGVRDGGPGEIEVRGPTLFREYWRRPEETREAFRDGWFRTGDLATLEDGYWRILGRSSVDIIKTGGYKVSALEIEEILRSHPRVADCAVVAVPDPEWGERVCVAVVPAVEHRIDATAGHGAPRNRAPGGDEAWMEELSGWARERLAAYKLPRRWRVVTELPRNAMGKVTKREVRKLFH